MSPEKTKVDMTDEKSTMESVQKGTEKQKVKHTLQESEIPSDDQRTTGDNTDDTSITCRRIETSRVSVDVENVSQENDHKTSQKDSQQQALKVLVPSFTKSWLRPCMALRSTCVQQVVLHRPIYKLCKIL